MMIADNRKRTDLQPRQTIPSIWEERAACPCCLSKRLKIVHLPDGPDYLSCAGCEMAFEVENQGNTIRLKNIPEPLHFAEQSLRYNWVHPMVLRQLLEKKAGKVQEETTPPVAPALSDRDVWKRMLALYRLGNQPKMIEYMLIQAGATREQVTAAAHELKQEMENETRQKNRKLWITMVITTLLITSLVAGSWVYARDRINAQLTTGQANPTAKQMPNMPLATLNSLPDAVKPEFLKGPAPRIERTGPPPTGCPRRPDQAAQLFGGDAQAWQPSSQPGSWQMISTGKPEIIHIPQNMYSGFINNKTFVFTSADGPATIYNVNFLVISCQ